MSVARSAYRHILSLAARAPQRVEDLDDLCFALFGILLNRSDFAAAGYGSDLNAIVRNCFLRPIIPDDPRDSVSSRLASSFVVLRKLREVENSRAWQLARERRKGLLVKVSGSISEPSNADTVLSAPPGTTSPTPKEEKKDPKDVGDMSQVLAAAEDTLQNDAKWEAVRHRVETKSLDAPESIASGVKTPIEDDNIVVGDATIFIERPKNHRVQKCSRHVVIRRDRVGIPPYSYLLPPEPMYHANIRHDFPFHLMNDAIVCLAARSALLKEQATRREGNEAGARDKEVSPPKKPPSARAHETTRSTDPPAFPAGSGARSPYDTLPRSLDELYGLLRSIPTRTVLQTDFVEMEVCTQYVCSNQPAEGPAPGAGDAVRDPGPQDGGRGGASPRHLFLYRVFLRVLGPGAAANPRRWHAQVLSQHLAVIDPARGTVVEMVRPGVVGNFPLLAPGESHAFESGTSLFGTDGILRGTIQLNAFNADGEMRTLDIAMAPTRLSVSARGRLPCKTALETQSDGDSSAGGSVKNETTAAGR